MFLYRPAAEPFFPPPLCVPESLYVMRAVYDD